MNNTITCAGALFYAQDTKRFLFVKRTDQKHNGAWGFVGGKSESKESAFEGLKREIVEEIGQDHPKILKYIPLEMFISNDTKFEYHTFVCVVKSEFIPRLNGEHNGYAWVSVGAWPKPLHQGVKSSLEKSITKNKLQTILDILY